MKIKLPVTWSMCGIVEVEADSIEDAIANFYDISDEIPLPDGCDSSYVDGSFELSTDNPEIIAMSQE